MESIRSVFYDPSLEECPWGRSVLDRFATFNPKPVRRTKLKEDLLLRSPDPIGEGKGILYLTPFRGPLVKRCPGTKGYTCCGYWVANVVVGCPMDCSYCVLQGYLDEPYITLQLPWQKVFDEVRSLIRSPSILRVGTGELSDSLALEPLLGFVVEAIPFFATIDGAILELKTKAAWVEGLLDLEHRGRTVLAWSLNPDPVISWEEHRTAPLRERLRAAQRCQEAGYPLAFHFDPMIHYPGWEEDYRGLVEELFRWVDPQGIIWISLGTLRFPLGLEKIIRGRFPRSSILSGELLPSEDGKQRYLKPLRIEMYRKMRSWLREFAPDLFIYLCMEREDVWKEVFGWSPGGTRGLRALFDQHVRDFLEGRR